MKRYPWETWQEAYVIRNGGLKPWKEIADVVGKTPLATRIKYCRMMGKCFREHFEKQMGSVFHEKRIA